MGLEGKAGPGGSGDAARVTKEQMLAMLDGVGANYYIRRIPKNGVLVWDNDYNPYASFVTKGLIEIYRLDKDGRKKTFDYCSVGGFCGFNVINEHATAIASGRACADSEVIAIPREEFFKAIHGCPDFADLVVKSLYALLTAQTNETASSAFYASAQRVPMLLCSLAKDEMVARGCLDDGVTDVAVCASSEPIVIPYDNNEIATILGISRNSVSSSVSRLQSQGIVRKTRGKIEIVDFDKLEKIAFMEA